MKTAEKVMYAFIGMSVLLSFFLPIASILSVLSISLLACFYMFLSVPFFYEIPINKYIFFTSFRGANVVRNIGVMVSGFAIAFILLGILYKLKLWPDSSFELLQGIVLSIIVTLITFFKYVKTKYFLYKKILLRLVIVGGLALALYFIPDNKLRAWYNIPSTVNVGNATGDG